jgi:predicted GIY-YIG superfamily endonuclease
MTKKEKARLRRAEQKAADEARRISTIRRFGIAEAIALVFEARGDGCKRSLSLERIKNTPVPTDAQVMTIYNALKKSGVVLVNRAGKITPSGLSGASAVRKAQLLYVVRAKEADVIKIGVSKAPLTRLRELQTSNPYSLFVAMLFDSKKSAVSLEKSVHTHFRKKGKWLRGEWFKDISDDDIARVVGERAQRVKC